MKGFKILIPIPIYNLVIPPAFERDEALPSQQNQNQEEKSVFFEEGIELNITAEDLMEAGYHNDRTPWTEEEDVKLLSLSKNTLLTWNEIAESMANRTPKMCYSRYRRLKSQTKQPWTSSQDKKIMSYVCQIGEKWDQIAENLKGRTAKQIEQHYSYCLKPEINRSQWNIEEDLYLVDLLRRFGKNWKIIEKNMNGRTQQQIKNRYFGRLKKLHQRKQQKHEVKTMTIL